MAEYRKKSQQLPAVPPEEACNGTWPYEARYTEAPDFRMHYVDEGKGEIVLALHGEPTWGYLFRNLIKTLQPEHFIPLFREAFPNCTTHRLDGVGHYCHEDAPEEIAKLIDEFLRKTWDGNQRDKKIP